MLNRRYPTLHRLLGAALLLGATAPVLAQEPAPAFWADAPAPPAASPLANALTHARAFVLNEAAARARLATAPPESRAGAAPLLLALPLPDGRAGRFAVWQTPVLAPALAAQFPAIATYAGQGLDDATATLRLDLTPAGLHAQVLSATAGATYIEPARRGEKHLYLSYYGRDVRAAARPTAACRQPDAPRKQPTAPPGRQGEGAAHGPAALGSGSLLRTYRLAVAATGEYTQFHGGTVPLGLAAIVTSVNAINGIFERELAVRFELVANNSQIVFTNPATDPYTDGNALAMLPENQATLTARIGPANYDVGHVFGGLNAGGRGVLRSPCQPATKAQGATALLAPVGDYFDVKYVCHELGHQFGANHVFNSASPGNCGPNRNAPSAWEPGSGSTIMGYAGLCPGDNLQFDSDPFYNAGSYEDMRAFITATACGVPAPTGNTPPTVRVPPSGVVLPVGTPFRLTAAGTDAEGDALLYNWQEQDLGSGGSRTTPQVANDNVPLFRNFLPTSSPTRYLPQLDQLLNPNLASDNERLPQVPRRLVFKCVASDLHRGPRGVVGGVTSSDSVIWRVTSAAGPFVVTAPAAARTWAGGSAQTVAWNVAGTTANGVGCAFVNVRLSTDGGYTYPTTLASRVPNSGSAVVQAPAIATATARVLVEAADSYFFNLSPGNFSISSPVVCAAPASVAVSAITNTGAQVSFGTSGAARRYLVSTVPATATQSVAASPTTLAGLTPGTAYTVQVVSDCAAGLSAAATASFVTTAPPVCGMPSELAITNRTTTGGTLGFVGAAGTSTYTITTLPASPVRTVPAGPVLLTGLAPGTAYTVRVTGSCANGSASATASLRFRTLPLLPPNDVCAGALPLACGARVLGSIESATATGDPTTFCTETVDGGGIFYRLTGTGGTISLTNCDPYTDYDTKLFVYQGPCGGPYTCVAGNDDTNANGCAQPSTVTFSSARGADYWVFMSGYGGETGNFALLSTCGPLATVSKAASDFQVWPNPTNGRPTLHVELPAAAPATATLHNIVGQKISLQSFNAKACELPLTGLPPGPYLLTVQAAGRPPTVRRLVVE